MSRWCCSQACLYARRHAVVLSLLLVLLSRCPTVVESDSGFVLFKACRKEDDGSKTASFVLVLVLGRPNPLVVAEPYICRSNAESTQKKQNR